MPALLAQAYGHSVAATVAVIKQLNLQIAALEQELAASFEMHPDAEIYLSLPGLGVVLGARAMAEFGDDRTRFLNPKARKSYAGTAPITKASGTRKVVLARVARNRRLADACYLWAFSALTRSEGARHRYDVLRARGQTVGCKYPVTGGTSRRERLVGYHARRSWSFPASIAACVSWSACSCSSCIRATVRSSSLSFATS